MEGADESTELWRHPIIFIVKLVMPKRLLTMCIVVFIVPFYVVIDLRT